MANTLKRIVMVVALVGLGWLAGQAQTTQPDFEIVVTAPPGQVNVRCARGCALSWVERGLNPNATATPSFTFSCNATSGPNCSSARIGGWIRP